MLRAATINDLLNLTLTNVEQVNTTEIIFTVNDGRQFKMYHQQDCCEDVQIEDVIGDLKDLIGTPIRQAEEAIANLRAAYTDQSDTWTFYKIATLKGYTTIRWWGSSNGYYSESVDFAEIIDDARIHRTY